MTSEPTDAEATGHRAIRSIQLADRTCRYAVQAGVLPICNPQGATIAEIFYLSYLLEGPAPETRPVTFALNGGPGAPAAYLNFGCMGPQRLQFGEAGDSLSDPPRTVDNLDTWLPLTDLVFIDPVDTGFSRSLLSAEETAARFYAVDGDIQDIAGAIYQWILENGRMTSPKYLVGESYSGFRAPRIAYHLQTRAGLGIHGLGLVSPYLVDGLSLLALYPEPSFFTTFSPIHWAATLPTLAAAHREGQGLPVTRADLAEVEAYARGEFVVDLLRGAGDPEAVARIVERLVDFTGLDRALLTRCGGRFDVNAIFRDSRRPDGRLPSAYDLATTAPDPFPWAYERRAGDPVTDRMVAPVTQAMADLVTRQLGWRPSCPYQGLNMSLNQQWAAGRGIHGLESVSHLRLALATDEALKVLVGHGFNDMLTPHFGTQLILDQMPPALVDGRVRLSTYPGGHTFYCRAESAAAFRRDAEWLFQRD